MKIKNPNPSCPNCQETMSLKAFYCRPCDLELRGSFPQRPFQNLNEDMLHFLNVFIHCEGKISDMEKALGISYPTVKSKMAQLKKLTQIQKGHEKKVLSPIEILSKMEDGTLSYSEGLKKIKELQNKKE